MRRVREHTLQAALILLSCFKEMCWGETIFGGYPTIVEYFTCEYCKRGNFCAT